MTAKLSEFDLAAVLGKKVPIGSLESEIAQMFADDGVEDSGEGMTRASLINLTVYTEDPSQLAESAQELAQITSQSACRSLLLAVDAEAQDRSVDAFVQAHCRVGPGGKREACSEQMSFLLGGTSAGLVRNTVFAHLDSDLPLVFWWRGDLSDVFEERLYSRIDRLIVDGDSWNNPRNQFVRLQEAWREGGAKFRIHDMAYTRLTGVRRVIAGLFDLPQLQNQVQSISKVALKCSPSQRIGAIYLAAWIAARLGVKLDMNASSEGDYRFVPQFGSIGGQVAIQIESDGDDGEFSGEMECEDYRVEFLRCQDTSIIRTQVHSKSPSAELIAERTYPEVGQNLAESINDILERGGRNRFFVNCMNDITELLAV
ncbi:MAG: glucose-6-phosphate dehydrogenase assembly protein OpcA [Verrucomicrobiota bacterium]